MKTALRFLVAIASALSFGCFVQIPIKDGADGLHVTGRKYVTQRELLLGETGLLPGSLAAFEVLEEESLRNRNQKYLRVPQGTEIRVNAIIKRRLEPGIFRDYKCKEMGSGAEFLMPFSMRDSIGLPEYTGWP